MQQGYAQSISRACLLLAVLACQACSSQPLAVSGNHSPGVTGAYETSGIVQVPPYTRTIFHTNNF